MDMHPIHPFRRHAERWLAGTKYGQYCVYVVISVSPGLQIIARPFRKPESPNDSCLRHLSTLPTAYNWIGCP